MDYQINENWLTLHVDQRFDQVTLQGWLDDYLPSKKAQHLLFQNKQIKLQDKAATRFSILHLHDKIQILAFTTGDQEVAMPYTFEVIYEDEFFLIINKPSQLLVHPDHSGQHLTLVNQLASYYKQQHIPYPIRPIHRLDYDTSGLLFVNKCSFLQPFMDDALSKKQIYRTYLAVVEGNFIQKTGTIQQPIGSDRHVNNRYRVSKHGKSACTHYQVLKQTKNQALLACTLETGRTHQIRVHLASIKHPILFDPIYGHGSIHHSLALHAWKLTFYHPIYEKNITVECAPPTHFPNV